MHELEEFLTSNTKQVLFELSEKDFFKNFTMVGGSGIAFYLKHRLSEDLDFFSWESTLPNDISNFIMECKSSYRLEITNLSNTYADFVLNDVKISLFAYNWELLKLKRQKMINNIYVADLDLLCVMKINALSMRAKFRDYYDLYILNKEIYDIDKMLDLSLTYLPGMTKKIFAMQLTFVRDIEDEDINHLSPKVVVTLEEIQKHFEREVRKIV
ncbi:MAG: nucleotidyl transferase AbiEii/AbiGii toxin family protein [Ignavibacteria bacterium]|nr:nucleotidyl transferase AbiEii/AbiGii toxin family protein [Ignavibacteria bacterium]